MLIHFGCSTKSKIKGLLLNSVSEVWDFLPLGLRGYIHIFESRGVGDEEQSNPQITEMRFEWTQELKYSSGYPDSQSNSNCRAREPGGTEAVGTPILVPELLAGLFLFNSIQAQVVFILKEDTGPLIVSYLVYSMWLSWFLNSLEAGALQFCNMGGYINQVEIKTAMLTFISKILFSKVKV